MTWAEEVRKAVEPFQIPCAQSEYQGNATTYLVFNGMLIPDNYADDNPQSERVLVMLHLFAPMQNDTMPLRKEIKQALRDAGFSYPMETDASEEEQQHIVFEFEKAQGV